MTAEDIGFLIGAIIGGLFAGAICGLLPLWLGRRNHRTSLGVAGLITCIFSGALLGLILALPVATIFSLVLLILGKPESEDFVSRREG